MAMEPMTRNLRNVRDFNENDDDDRFNFDGFDPGGNGDNGGDEETPAPVTTPPPTSDTSVIQASTIVGVDFDAVVNGERSRVITNGAEFNVNINSDQSNTVERSGGKTLALDAGSGHADLSASQVFGGGASGNFSFNPDAVTGGANLARIGATLDAGAAGLGYLAGYNVVSLPGSQAVVQVNSIIGIDFNVNIDGDRNLVNLARSDFNVDIDANQSNTANIVAEKFGSALTARSAAASSNEVTQINLITGIRFDINVEGDRDRVDLQRSVFDVDIVADQTNNAGVDLRVTDKDGRDVTSSITSSQSVSVNEITGIDFSIDIKGDREFVDLAEAHFAVVIRANQVNDTTIEAAARTFAATHSDAMFA